MDLAHSYDENENNLGIDGIANVRPGAAPGRKKESEGNVVMWSACLDNADSHEVVTDDGRYKGAMSHAFQQCLRQLPEQSYLNLRQIHLPEMASAAATPVDKLSEIGKLS
ncbi:hypothetical protein M408DRAFT_174810 [Serendipita vermifera MAFF 305830]|uniref:Uncharacterized protein n=1 Tax=Serendipita vermifera MAFF 305830 TaxID=933852 RepID=A0A0C3B5Y2_SERVB|nr:hypothetical protein M408DRAFT_174810 [Serendipita vermifera MAFF 305830]